MSNKINNGGPAFPAVFSGKGKILPEEHSGMTLRDYFAAKAMQAIIAKFPPVRTDKDPDIESDLIEIADGAYVYADAMLAAREANQ